jgi:putative transcriptional regulator
MKRYIDLAKIRALRKQKGLTQEDMAQALGYMTAIGYHYLETGKRRITAERLALVVITVIMLKSVVAHHIGFE